MGKTQSSAGGVWRTSTISGGQHTLSPESLSKSRKMGQKLRTNKVPLHPGRIRAREEKGAQGMFDETQSQIDREEELMSGKKVRQLHEKARAQGAQEDRERQKPGQAKNARIGQAAYGGMMRTEEARALEGQQP